MMLTAYFDESGHARDPRACIVGIAGLVAPARRWETFESDWRLLLSKHTVSEFHMKDFAHSRGEFRKWSEFKRRGFLQAALDVIVSTKAAPLGCMVDLHAFRQLDERAQRAFRDPYYMALQFCLQASLDYAKREPVTDKINIVFDRAEEFLKSAGTLTEAFINHDPLGHRVGSYGFAKTSEMVPLQAADLVAYELAHRLEHIAMHPLRLPRWPFTVLLQMSKAVNMQWFHLWDATALKREEQRFLNMLEWERQTRAHRQMLTKKLERERTSKKPFNPQWVKRPRNETFDRFGITDKPKEK